MQYKIESIGAQFSNKGIAALEKRLDEKAEEGYKFHSVFHVSQPGCLGMGQGTTTYLAVYVKE
ncbi:MAG: hypothetical protein ACTS9Y_03390 [Methylophilus sp.]|uniref:hypothetical protein n=1 Tax=Methylophilus sp. TaxID=29541 RepID=UPI003F9F8790